jgi:RNA-splicing ligase RtcB
MIFILRSRAQKVLIKQILQQREKKMERDNLTHGARTAMNRSQEIREWAETYLKNKTRAEKQEMTDEEFEKFWKYHKPEIMHEGAAEAIQAYKMRNEDN